MFPSPNNIPGRECVGLSRTNILTVWLLVKHLKMSIMAILKIGTTQAYELRNFIYNIKFWSIPSYHYYHNAITQFNPNEWGESNNHWRAFLLHWYIIITTIWYYLQIIYYLFFNSGLAYFEDWLLVAVDCFILYFYIYIYCITTFIHIILQTKY